MFLFRFDRYGSWGVCYTYATWFALEGLAVSGKAYDNCLAMREGVRFLLMKQNKNGGWGESYISGAEQVNVSIMNTLKSLISKTDKSSSICRDT